MTRPVSLLLLVASLLAGAGPLPAADEPVARTDAAPGRLRIFEDWAVGCDNRLACTAVALRPDGRSAPYAVLVRIERDGGPEGGARLDLIGGAPLPDRLQLVVDGMEVAQMPAAHDRARADGLQALRLIRLLGSSYALEIRHGTEPLESPSLNGLAMALRYVDEQQGRVGSVAALAAIGDLPADLARPAPEPVSIVWPAAAPPAQPPSMRADELGRARGLASCGGRTRTAEPAIVDSLDGRHALVLLPCKAGAANVSAVALVATGGPGAWQFEVAHFDRMPGTSDAADAPPLVVNALWSPARRELTSLARGRPLGDCGTRETWRWDGAAFRLIEARAMPVCRGAWEWPVLWSSAPPVSLAAAPSP